MEKKTIGGLIAILRKEKGMTQKQLAEMLQVTDKTVSRWERDETLPDLTLIPVIAEIFGVTSDELLRGERKMVKVLDYAEDTGQAKAEGDGKTADESARKRREKQLRRILIATKEKYRTHSIISAFVGVSAGLLSLGLVAEFSVSMLGIVIGVIIMLGAAIHQMISASNAFVSIDSAEFSMSSVKELKQYIADKAVLVINILIGCFLMMLFFVMMERPDIMGWGSHFVCCIGAICLSNIASRGIRERFRS